MWKNVICYDLVFNFLFWKHTWFILCWEVTEPKRRFVYMHPDLGHHPVFRAPHGNNNVKLFFPRRDLFASIQSRGFYNKLFWIYLISSFTEKIYNTKKFTLVIDNSLSIVLKTSYVALFLSAPYTLYPSKASTWTWQPGKIKTQSKQYIWNSVASRTLEKSSLSPGW